MFEKHHGSEGKWREVILEVDWGLIPQGLTGPGKEGGFYPKCSNRKSWKHFGKGMTGEVFLSHFI